MQQRAGFAFRTIFPAVANLATFVLLPTLVFGLPLAFRESSSEFDSGTAEIFFLAIKLSAISTVLAWSTLHAVAECFSFQLSVRNIIVANMAWSLATGLPFLCWLAMVSSC